MLAGLIKTVKKGSWASHCRAGATAATASGRIINFTNISRESGIPVATLRTYYQVLEDTFVGYRIPAFGAAGRKRVLTTPRFLFYDNGVRNAAARYRFSSDLLKSQIGLLLENWVGQELIHRCLYAGRAHRLSFWRTARRWIMCWKPRRDIERDRSDML